MSIVRAVPDTLTPQQPTSSQETGGQTDPSKQRPIAHAGVQAVPMEVREMHPTWLLERDVDGVVDGPLVESLSATR